MKSSKYWISIVLAIGVLIISFIALDSWIVINDASNKSHKAGAKNAIRLEIIQRYKDQGEWVTSLNINDLNITQYDDVNMFFKLEYSDQDTCKYNIYYNDEYHDKMIIEVP